ncbi:MAG: hypothetical protein IKB07_08300 [Lachnospiraceae bacterium]|nr:hypothetical protein [Lachnospiraceae bacterium]
MSNAVSKEGALQSLKLYRLQRCFSLSDDVLDVAISALEEVQELHAIGTVSEFRELKEKKYDCDIKHLVGECSYAETGCSDCIGKLKIKDALEKATAKKVRELNERKDLYVASCTLCGHLVRRNQRYCDGCGQKLDWSKGKE